MNVLLISANTETLNMSILPMGLGLVAAAAKQAGHNVRFLDLMAETEPEAALADVISLFRPEAIGVSIRNVDDQVSAAPRFLLEAARSVVATCKRLSKAPVILGGAGYSMFPESALEYLGADMGIQGEGEAAFVALLSRIKVKANVSDVPGLYLPRKGCRTPPNFHQRLDDWPFPNPAIFASKRFQDPACYLPFQTRRGCALRCTYCATEAIEGTGSGDVPPRWWWMSWPAGRPPVFRVSFLSTTPSTFRLIMRTNSAFSWQRQTSALPGVPYFIRAAPRNR